mgnify:CR=1 FL=1
MRRIFEAVYQVFFDKKWGILIKRESESLDFTGLEIPRDYVTQRRLLSMNEVVEVRMASWKAMVQERSASGLSIEEWCAANNDSESQ